jgi:phage gpG-like protein
VGMEVKINFDAVKLIDKMSAQFATRLVGEVSKQTLYFISSIQKNQMSGRRGGVYLNVDTGNLRRSWFPETHMKDGMITTRAWTNVKYAAIHEHGGTVRRKARESVLSFRRGRAGFVRPSKAQFQQKVSISEGQSIIPKRLFIREQFDREMPERYQKAVIKVIEELKR